MNRVRTNQGYPVRTEGWGVGGLPFPETEREIISTPDYDIYERGWGVKVGMSLANRTVLVAGFPMRNS